MFRLMGCLLLFSSMVLVASSSTHSEPIHDYQETIQFKDAGQSVTAQLIGSNGYRIAWRLQEHAAYMERVLESGAVIYRDRQDDIKAVWPNGIIEEEPLDEEEFIPTLPVGLNLYSNYLEGVGTGGNRWRYGLPENNLLNVYSVQADWNGNIYFHDIASNWYSLDSQGNLLFSIQWESDRTEAECRVTPAGDSVCASPYTGLFAVRKNKAEKTLSLFINGRELFYYKEPLLKESITYVPMRALFEAVGAEVIWDQQAQAVEAERGNRSVRLAIGSKGAWVNGRVVILEHEPLLIDGTTYIPLRFVGEALGAQIIWEAATWSIQVVASHSFSLGVIPSVVDQSNI